MQGLATASSLIHVIALEAPQFVVARRRLNQQVRPLDANGFTLAPAAYSLAPAPYSLPTAPYTPDPGLMPCPIPFLPAHPPFASPRIPLPPPHIPLLPPQGLDRGREQWMRSGSK